MRHSLTHSTVFAHPVSRRWDVLNSPSCSVGLVRHHWPLLYTTQASAALVSIPAPGHAMESFLDYCLTCDRQTNGTTYCSQACRLAELDHSTHRYVPYSSKHRHDSYPTSQTSSWGKGLHLPPAYNFSLHRTTSQTSISSQTSRTSTLSDQVRIDLEEYAGAFDRTRKQRRISL